MDRGAWQVTVHGVTKELDMAYRLNNISVNSEILHCYKEHGSERHFFFHWSIIAMLYYFQVYHKVIHGYI